MNEQQLVRALNAVGMRCFIAWFRQFCDPSLSNEDVAAQMQEAESYSAKACRSRVSGARRIIRAGRGRDALTIIANSRADTRTKQGAVTFLTSRG